MKRLLPCTMHGWMDHLEDLGPGVVGIRRHGRMVTDAAVVAHDVDALLRGDRRAPEQLVNAACMPGAVGRVWAMADHHFGYGLPIGGVLATDHDAGEQGGAISPGAVGFDINCGVRMLAFDLMAEDLPDPQRLARRLGGRLPAGTSGGGGVEVPPQALQEVLNEGAQAAADLGLGFVDDVGHLESRGRLDGDPSLVSERAIARGATSLGTLGSGNHFAELQRVEHVLDEDAARSWGLHEGQLVAMIHSGSRGLGHQVCTDHVRYLERQYVEQDGGWWNEAHGWWIPDRQLAATPRHHPDGEAYVGAMGAAANFAFANRAVLAQRLLDGLNAHLGSSVEATTVYDVAHNIAKDEEHLVDGRRCTCCVHRKGATRAFPHSHPELAARYQVTGQPVLVPGDMGNGSWLLAGPRTGMSEAFGSSCHGAGRTLSRHAARELVDVPALKARLASSGIHLKHGSDRSLGEEAPEAYKPVDDVVQATVSAGLATPVARLAPKIVLKG